jgi:hypothetical protein
MLLSCTAVVQVSREVLQELHIQPHARELETV